MLLPGKNIVPMPDTSKEIKLIENVDAFKVKIKHKELIKLDNIAGKIAEDFEASSDTQETFFVSCLKNYCKLTKCDTVLCRISLIE